ncbi:putative SnoaL-like aldol condensation-catalyzing enzyme [Nocardia transvalensis]|uniref:Putative SnoaL-like aldol condensation-catalyzing enzyme n=1 Tax=Nocardia transvalensis TaxID=37333 RepID=A0A7W9UL99_9NOCA|nr:nuclear transport factor 2 family protein [Nocardia transvalensis]MBB5917162.1 putative SnoaL-like aldol condensation-catalyzing enzyme [Nocardia transvalensis]
MRDFGIALYNRWADLWNGDLAVADEIMAPALTLRYAQAGADVFDEIRDPRALAARIEAFRAERPGLRYEAQGEPVVEMAGDRTGLVARPYGARWSSPEREIDLSGTDILRFVDGRIVEVWSVSGGAAGRSFYPAA